MKKNRVFYRGDVNQEYGGYWYSLAGFRWGYASVIRVTPCSDAGGPSNCFWVESLTVNLDRKQSDIDSALSCVGLAEEYEKATVAQRRHMLIDAFTGYGFYDVDKSTMVQIGKPDKFYAGHEGEFKPDVILRGNSTLANYVRREWLHEVQS